MSRALLALALLVFGDTALAVSPAAGPLWYMKVENDVVFSSDRWYTSGVRLARVEHDIEWGLDQEIYTPDPSRLDSTDPDRAPAARLLLSVSRHFRGASAYQTVGLSAGVRGPSALGRDATELVHRFIPARDVDWSRQLGDEYDLAVIWTRTQRSAAESPMGEGLKLHFGTVLGNQQLFAHVGVEYRVGSPGARGLSSPALRFAPTPPLTDAGARPEGWSAYFGASVRGVARNELISRDYDPTKPDLELNKGMLRGVAGVSYAARWGSIDFGLVRETREFTGQTRPHGWGSLTVHLHF